jgi:hypothetical protein
MLLMVRLWPLGLRRHEEEFARLEVLQQLPDEADPQEALQLVAAASAASLPKGDKLGRSYLEEPSRHFGVKSARAGQIDRVKALLVWTDPDVRPSTVGGATSHSGSASGDTYVFAELPQEVPWATMWFRPRSVPHDPETQPTSSNPAFDDAFLWAGDDPEHSLPPAVMDVLLGAERGLFAWNAFFERQFCIHSTDSPDSDKGQADQMVPFAVSVARAYG